MGKQTPLRVTFNLPDGREVALETGKLASQADGSAMIRVGDTMLLATIVSATKAKEGQAFFPLSVDYQEKYAAAGRIPGNFFRRETKLSDYEILISRLVDRALRPLFPDGYMNETQVIINLISADKDVMPDALAGLAASTAVAVSNIPVEALFSEVRVARIDGQFVVNPNRTELAKADMDFIVAATERDITMVEGEANECQEADMIEALKIAHEVIRVQIDAQKRLAQLVGDAALVKRAVEPPVEHEDLKKRIEEVVSDEIYTIARSASDKHQRKDALDAVKTRLMETLTTEMGEEFMKEWAPVAERYYDKRKKFIIRDVILSDQSRLDGRKPDQIRPIWCEVSYLPAAHGSSIFTRGETQSLTTLTLGTKEDTMLYDTALDFRDEPFLLHYNFPPYSTGEVKPMRGPGRREVGHANLAARSIRKVMPDNFPYTIRIVSDILESNGSSSMATVCAGSMALMDGGVPVKAPVAGIAMGCIADDKGRVCILSDILGDEDALGDMDFKVTGTANGITGTQMDIKIDGMPYELLEKALEQARAGRLHILGEMAKAIDAPAPDLKPHAPRTIQVRIERDYIGAIIGPGGKIIQEMQRSTGTTITVEEDEIGGMIYVFGPDKASIDAVQERINEIVFVPTPGDVFDGEVERVEDYGIFVKFKGKSGLVHVTEMSYQRVPSVSEIYKIGDKVRFQVMENDPKTGKLRLSIKALLEKPEGYVERERTERPDRRPGGGGGGFRGGSGGGDRRGGGGGGRR
ncbi:MAG: polyribonucleotide nucleotidyltransferase [Chitinophagales bacterium]